MIVSYIDILQMEVELFRGLEEPCSRLPSRGLQGSVPPTKREGGGGDGKRGGRGGGGRYWFWTRAASSFAAARALYAPPRAARNGRGPPACRTEKITCKRGAVISNRSEQLRLRSCKAPWCAFLQLRAACRREGTSGGVERKRMKRLCVGNDDPPAPPPAHIRNWQHGPRAAPQLPHLESLLSAHTGWKRQSAVGSTATAI